MITHRHSKPYHCDWQCLCERDKVSSLVTNIISLDSKVGDTHTPKFGAESSFPADTLDPANHRYLKGLGLKMLVSFGTSAHFPELGNLNLFLSGNPYGTTVSLGSGVAGYMSSSWAGNGKLCVIQLCSSCAQRECSVDVCSENEQCPPQMPGQC